MVEKEENPLIAALPPETDYLTYLTIIEYNLTKEQLPTLHEILQDVKLTTNIGWDLIHLLIPLLPESEQCLQDISFLGNPRETILKVAEILDSLGQAGDGESDFEQHQHSSADDDDVDDAEKNTQESKEPIDLLSLQFQSLLHMLCILHPRIQTKNPSRFLTTSLQAVIKAFRSLQQEVVPDSNHERLQSTTRAILMLIKSMSGSKRPHLPPRRSQPAIPTVSTRESAPDPEASQDSLAPGEVELKKQILQSFVTHVLEVYIQSLEPTSLADSPLVWSTRYHEWKNPVPGKPSYAIVHEVETELERADATIGQILSSGEYDLQISWDEMLHNVLEEAHHSDITAKSIFNISDLPASRAGALYAIAAKAVTNLLNDRSLPFTLSIFPEHSLLVEAFVDDSNNNIDGDALIILGQAALDTNSLGDFETRTEFNQYLQRLSQLAASSSLPNIASLAAELVANVLHAHPSSDARFDFIQDTLEHCPYPELKEAAVLWLKDEICSAFNLTTTSVTVTDPNTNQAEQESDSVFGETSNIFTHPETLKTAAAYIFAETLVGENKDISPDTQAKFWLAALNLYYLLLANTKLHETLAIEKLTAELNIERHFLRVLGNLVQKSKHDPPENPQEGYEPYLSLIEDALDRIRCVPKRINTENVSNQA